MLIEVNGIHHPPSVTTSGAMRRITGTVTKEVLPAATLTSLMRKNTTARVRNLAGSRAYGEFLEARFSH